MIRRKGMKSRQSALSIVFLLCWVWLGISILKIPSVEAGIGNKAPEITNKVWLNSKPLRLADLQGKVVMVEFWTFGCWNCRNIEPYVKAWHKKYADQGLVVIAIHSPEFQYEKNIDRVQDYINQKELPYAVPIDNKFTTWRKFRNRYWPTLYLIDKNGIIQYTRIGEGEYETTEKEIQRLLAETQ